jgi:hypothetical protein
MPLINQLRGVRLIDALLNASLSRLLVNELMPYGMDQIKGYGQNRMLRS